VTDKFAMKDENGMEQNFSSIAEDKQKDILKTKLLIYECTGEESEIKQWFKTINIAGIPLNIQEINNAIYSGPFVTLAKAEFSNSANSNIQKWSAYIKGNAIRQDFLECAIDWVSNGKIDTYMSLHRYDTNIDELKIYFNTVIDWISTTFIDVEKEMCGLEWGRLYDTYHTTVYDPIHVSRQVKTLYGDSSVKTRKGIFEYILGGMLDTKLLDIRFFEESVIRIVYGNQTNIAKKENISNCPLCAI
jgi:hypothetical protein